MARRVAVILSVIMGALVGVLTNLITQGFTWPLLAGLAAAVLISCLVTLLQHAGPASGDSPSPTAGDVRASGGSIAIGRNWRGRATVRNTLDPAVPPADPDAQGNRNS
jgi:hypothetical protein